MPVIIIHKTNETDILFIIMQLFDYQNIDIDFLSINKLTKCCSFTQKHIGSNLLRFIKVVFLQVIY